MIKDINFSRNHYIRTNLSNDSFDEKNHIEPHDIILCKNINQLYTDILCLLNKYDACFFNCIKNKYTKEIRQKYFQFINLEKQLIQTYNQVGINIIRKSYLETAKNTASITNFELQEELNLRGLLHISNF